MDLEILKALSDFCGELFSLEKTLNCISWWSCAQAKDAGEKLLVEASSRFMLQKSRHIL